MHSDLKADSVALGNCFPASKEKQITDVVSDDLQWIWGGYSNLPQMMIGPGLFWVKKM